MLEWGATAFSVAAAAASLQSCPILCDPIDGSPPGSAVPGILQARTLEWIAFAFSVNNAREIQIKATIRCHLTMVEWVSSKSLQIINAREGVEKWKHSYNTGGNVNWRNHYGKQYGGSLKKNPENRSTI